MPDLPRFDPAVRSPINSRFGVEHEDLADGTVRLSLAVEPWMLNEVGVAHGGIAMFLMDGAMGRCCCLTLKAGETCATVQLSVQFLAPARGRIAAHARVTKRGRRVAFLESTCASEDGTVIGVAQGTWAISTPR